MKGKYRCRLCRYDKKIDYKDVSFLEKFIDHRGKIISREFTGNCAKHQRITTRAIKRARILALLPFVR